MFRSFTCRHHPSRFASFTSLPSKSPILTHAQVLQAFGICFPETPHGGNLTVIDEELFKERHADVWEHLNRVNSFTDGESIQGLKLMQNRIETTAGPSIEPRVTSSASNDLMPDDRAEVHPK